MTVATQKESIRFEVEWCSGVPNDECGDADLDRAVYVREHFKNFKDAERRAVEIANSGKDFFGCVRIEEQERRIDADILEVEHRRVWWWEDCRVWHVNFGDKTAFYG